MQGSVRDTISLFLCVYIRTYIHTVRIHTCALPPPTHSCTLAHPHPHPHYTHTTHPPTCTTSCFSISMKVRQMSKASCLVLGLPLKAFATSPGTTSPHTLQTWSRAQHFTHTHTHTHTHTQVRHIHVTLVKHLTKATRQIIAYLSSTTP